MSFNQLDNCPKCGTLFVRSMRDVCHNCFQEEEKEYLLVSNYLRERKNREATIQQVSEDTGVSIKQITKFIRNKRISLMGLPNMGYPCESCGNMTRDGQLCPDCTEKFTKGIDQMINEENIQQERDRYRIKDTGYMQEKYNDKRR